MAEELTRQMENVPTEDFMNEPIAETPQQVKEHMVKAMTADKEGNLGEETHITDKDHPSHRQLFKDDKEDDKEDDKKQGKGKGGGFLEFFGLAGGRRRRRKKSRKKKKSKKKKSRRRRSRRRSRRTSRRRRRGGIGDKQGEMEFTEYEEPECGSDEEIKYDEQSGKPFCEKKPVSK